MKTSARGDAGVVAAPAAPASESPSRRDSTGALQDTTAASRPDRIDATGSLSDTTRPQVGSTRGRADSADRPLDSLAAKDTARHLPPAHRWLSPYPGEEACADARETATGCWRDHRGVAAQEVGFPGTRGWTLSLTEWEPLAMQSPFTPAGSRSQYLSGGMAPPERFALRKLGGGIVAIDEIWTPVAPLDTPVTSLDWERGALGMNNFHLKLKRMLSDGVYLGLEYYSASAEAQEYDYQFNVHQPYLGGWGFLGQLYRPIDRDSGTIVLKGVSPSISALDFTPRVGFWIDTDQVVEAYMSRIKNVTSLASPRDSLVAVGDTTQPFQTPLRSGFAGYTGGLIYGFGHGRTGSRWTSQLEAGYSSLEKLEGRGGGGSDKLSGDVFRVRGAFAAPRWALAPALSFTGVSEAWRGDPFLSPPGVGLPTQGWTDAESADLGLAPRWSWLELSADGGATRNSRMDGRTRLLARSGAYGKVHLPFGFDADAGLSYRERDPDWELLYRSNPAVFLYPNPALASRADMGYRGSVSLALPFLSLEAGVNLLRSDNAWLPTVLPMPGVCADLEDSLYAYAAAPKCSEAGADTSLPDSLALRLRNYKTERRDSWHLGLGTEVGHWSLRLENHFLFTAQVADPSLRATLQDRSVPERVFKGRLRWKRRLLDDKLGLDFHWDWEWYSTRYAWKPGLDGASRLTKLDEYLTLDFEAGMRIKTFLLYFKVMNLNHDRYFTEPGVHPPGVNFRFGVDWTLFN